MVDLAYCDGSESFICHEYEVCRSIHVFHNRGRCRSGFMESSGLSSRSSYRPHLLWKEKLMVARIHSTLHCPSCLLDPLALLHLLVLVLASFRHPYKIWSRG